MYWVELHCDKGLDFNDDCVNFSHSYPMAGFLSLRRVRSTLQAEAKRRGWQVTDGEVICRSCAKKIAKEKGNGKQTT